MKFTFLSLPFEKPQSAEFEAESQSLKSAEELLVPFLTMFILVLAVVVSCLAVVKTSFEYRQLFNQHQLLVKESDQLQVEWGQLLLEQSAWASNNRVEQQAKKSIAMYAPVIEQVEVVINDGY